MDKGQGATEYLLLLAMAVVVAGVAITLMTDFGGEARNEINEDWNAIPDDLYISVCGNEVAEAGEDCDKTDKKGKVCADLPGFSSGTLNCNRYCEFDTSGCA